uniref:(northern house mosquito) hypothetical protein n=1 Tax=Culex pipiens TaxID=7175 RepID=A0A8D8N3T4_CULPI
MIVVALRRPFDLACSVAVDGTCWWRCWPDSMKKTLALAMAMNPMKMMAKRETPSAREPFSPASSNSFHPVPGYPVSYLCNCDRTPPQSPLAVRALPGQSHHRRSNSPPPVATGLV